MPASNHRKSNFETFRDLDRLPAELYREVCFAARVWDATTVRDIYQGAVRSRGKNGAIRWLVASIQAGDEQDVINYAFQYQLKYGTPLPHMAAEATILRFEESRGVRPQMPPRGLPARTRRAWQSSDSLMPR